MPSDEVGMDRRFGFGADQRRLVGALQVIGHVVAEGAHDLKAFEVLPDFFGLEAVGRVPVLRGNHRHLIDGEIFVEPVEGRAGAAAPAVDHACRGFVFDIFPGREEEPVEDGAERSRRAGIIDRSPDDDAVARLDPFDEVHIERVLEYAEVLMVDAVPASGTALNRLAADMEDFGGDAVALKRSRNFGKGGEDTAVGVGTAVDEQDFHDAFSCGCNPASNPVEWSQQDLTYTLLPLLLI